MSELPQTAATSNELPVEGSTLAPADQTGAHAFRRLEQVLGGELARLLVDALSDRDGDRPELVA